MKKLLIVFLLIGIFCISLVSAGALDFNKKYFHEEVGEYGKVSIEDWFGFGKQAELTLTENTEVCPKEKCKAIIPEFIMYEDGILIEDIRFIGDQPKSYQIYINDEPYEIGTEVKEGTYDVRIEGELEILQQTDWQIKVSGYWIEEWALWDASGGIVHYYKFDETSGTFGLDTKGTTDGFPKNMTGTSPTDEGFINYGIDGVSATTTGSPRAINETGAWAINMWVNHTAAQTGNVFSIEGNDTNRFVLESDGDIRVFWNGADSGSQAQGVPTDGTEWSMLTLVHDTGTEMSTYYNGVWYDNFTALGSNVDNNDFRIGRDGNGADSLTAVFDEVGIWNRTLTDAEVLELYNGGAGLPADFGTTITLNSPTDNLNTINKNLQFNMTASLINGNLVNATLEIYNPAGSLRATNFTSLTGTLNNTVLSISDFVINNSYKWNYFVCSNNLTDDICNYANSNRTFNIIPYEYNLETFNLSSYETSTESFTLNISVGQDTTISSATLNFNGTSYAGINIGNATEQIWIYSLTNENNVIGNKTFNWTVDYGEGTKQTNTRGQFVNNTVLGLCNGSLITPYVNFSFKDEADDSSIVASISTSTFNYWIGDGSVNKTLTYINNTANPSYPFCSIPSDKILNVDMVIQYKNATSYPQRTYDPSLLSLSNDTTNVTLYLLNTVDGIYVTFQVINTAEQPISGVSVNATRIIGSETVTIGDGTTDAGGAVTFWMNPDFLHTVSFFKTGFPLFSTTLTPTQTTYTVTLGGSPVEEVSDFTRGIGIITQPGNKNLFNNTIYNFNYTLSSSYWTVDEFGFILKYINGTIIGTQTDTSNGGILTLNANTLDSNKIVMDYYYIIDSNYTNGTSYWLISTANSYSIWNLFTNIEGHISNNILGIQSDDEGYFAKALISVLILIMVSGTLSFKYGLRSEAAITGIIFGLVLLLNTLGMIPTPDTLVSRNVDLGNVVVFIVALLALTAIFKEEQR